VKPMGLAVKTVGRLQALCADVFDDVVGRLQAGMSEFGIAQQLNQAFATRDITEYWYDVPLMVSIGTDRFKEGTTTTDYAVKGPSKNVRLEAGVPLFIDMSPLDTPTRLWGDWASTIVFQPREQIDDEQVAFLQTIKQIHRAGIARITAQTTGADLAKFYLGQYKEQAITLLDVRNNTGHSIHAGPKSEAKRTWLDLTNTTPLGEGIFAIEPGGFRSKKGGSGIVVGRFEVCVYIPAAGNAHILGE